MNEVRYIENPFAKIFNIVNPDTQQLYNLLLKLLAHFFKNVKLPSLRALTSLPEKSKDDPNVYVGTAGYLVMLLRLHEYFSRGTEERGEEFLRRSHLVGDEGFNQLTDPLFYLKLAQEQFEHLSNYIKTHRRSLSSFSFFMSEAGVWLSGLHLGYRTRNQLLFRQNENRLRACFQQLKANIDRQEWELLYGVPGFLFTVLQAQKHYEGAEELFKTNFGPIAKELTHMIVREGISNYEALSKKKVVLDKLPEDFRLVYYFYKKEYLGGAHGLAGNLSVILSAMKYNDFGEETLSLMGLLKGSIYFLLRHLINGNFSSSAGSTRVNLVHFCHGAPGVVTALAKFTEMFPEAGITMGLKEVLDVSLAHIWKYGVLKKGFGLCHGISGNAYTFISPSIQQVLHDRVPELLKKAQFFALLHEEPDVMAEIRRFKFEDRLVVGHSDEPYSLMVGVAGDICFTIDVLRGSGLFPGFDL